MCSCAQGIWYDEGDKLKDTRSGSEESWEQGWAETTLDCADPASACAEVEATEEARRKTPWTLGFQLGVCHDAGGRAHVVIGHGASGGTLGLCIPTANLVVAITVSKLSPGRVATRKLVDTILGEFRLRMQHAPGPGLLHD